MTVEQQIIVETALAMILLEAGTYTYDTILVKRSLTGDSASGPCEECDANEAEGWIDSEAIYPSGDDGPPFHPNAVLAGSTFAPYGRLIRVISAEYDSMAIRLHAGEYSTTIGPNHPMLTTSGLKAAKLLNVGDQLICDRRGLKAFRHSNEANFNQVKVVEDIFASLKMAFGGGFVSTSANDFHGDTIIDQHKVEVVFPKRELLEVFYSCGIERFCEGGFMLTNVSLETKAAVGLTDQEFQRFLLPAPSGMRGSNIGVDCTGHLCVRTIHSITPIAQLRTRAFDASTETGIYCSDGFVVSNCVCDEEYKEKRIRVYN